MKTKMHLLPNLAVPVDRSDTAATKQSEDYNGIEAATFARLGNALIPVPKNANVPPVPGTNKRPFAGDCAQ